MVYLTLTQFDALIKQRHFWLRRIAGYRTKRELDYEFGGKHLISKLQEFQDMFGDADSVAVLIYDLDFCDGLARFFIH